MPRLLFRSGLLALLTALAMPAAAETTPPRWVGSWASSQMVPNPDGLIPAEFGTDVTVRQVVRLSVSGTRIRLKLSNVHGRDPMVIAQAYVARSTDVMTSRIGDGKAITFNGRAEVTIPAGAEYLSDPIDFPVAALENLSISLYLPKVAGTQTGHPGARSLTWFVKGNAVSAPELTEPKSIERWFHIAGIDIEAERKNVAIVALGDSITDGYGVKPGTNARWTDHLAERLQADPRKRHIAVLNHGIGGGAVLRGGLGPNAMARFERDVLGQPGARYLILLEGVNDLGGLSKYPNATDAEHEQLVAGMIAAYQQMILRARERGLKVYGATILPFSGNGYDDAAGRAEKDRQAINKWIRESGAFDKIIDLDLALRDPEQPNRLNPAYDSGDHLHPSMAGYKAIGDAIDLRLFE